MNPLGLEDDTQRITSEARLRGLKTRENAQTPLLALPDDVLYKILHALVCSDHYSFDYDLSDRLPYFPSRAFTKPSVWMPVMGVCTQLRNLAIKSPLLWSYLDFGGRSGVDRPLPGPLHGRAVVDLLQRYHVRGSERAEAHPHPSRRSAHPRRVSPGGCTDGAPQARGTLPSLLLQYHPVATPLQAIQYIP
jgi:hypothetical protein